MSNKPQFFLYVFGKDPNFVDDGFRVSIFDGDFHTFATKAELDKTLGELGAKPHENEILRGQQLIQIEDGRAAAIVKGVRFGIMGEVN